MNISILIVLPFIVTNFFSYCFPSNKTSIFWFGDICGILKFVGPPPGLYGLTSKIILSDEFSYLKSLIIEALSKLKTIYSPSPRSIVDIGALTSSPAQL